MAENAVRKSTTFKEKKKLKKEKRKNNLHLNFQLNGKILE